jgi:hypothetical protein
VTRILLSVLTTDQKGVIAEPAVVLEAVRAGVGVFQPLGDERYDLIPRGPNGFLHSGYRPGEIDAIAAYCAALDRCYLLPSELSIDRALVQLRLTPTRNKQQLRINWACDFDFAATLRGLQGP